MKNVENVQKMIRFGQFLANYHAKIPDILTNIYIFKKQKFVQKKKKLNKT